MFSIIDALDCGLTDLTCIGKKRRTVSVNAFNETCVGSAINVLCAET